MKTERILAIDPGTKIMGVAILEGRELLYYGLKTIRRPKSPQEVLSEAAQIIRNLIACYQPTALAIEKNFLFQKSASLLIVLTEEIKEIAQRAGLNVYEFAVATIRKHICKSEKATKKQTAGCIATLYPELSRHLSSRTRWGDVYYAHLFDAVAVGLAAHMGIPKLEISDSK
jgi:Holliday junction resolvasome RuvABC endonuclease subunit